MFVLDIIYFFTGCLALPYLILRFFWDPQYYQKRIDPLIRPIPRRKSNKPCIWVHGVSVGEVLAVENFVSLLEEAFPGHEVVISTTTTTGFDIAKKTFPGRMIFHYPLDFTILIERAFKRIQPSLILLVELEVWPNFLSMAEKKGIPVMVINGRISQRSFQGYNRGKPFFTQMFYKVSQYCVQTPEYAKRFKTLGVPEERILVTGNLKYDNLFTGDPLQLQKEMGEQLFLHPEDAVLIGGSTHPGEEEILLEIYQEISSLCPNLHLILAPRHPQRVPEIIKMIRGKGMEVTLRTAMKKMEKRSLANENKKIILVDTIGELSKIYAVASVVFVGGSLIPRGGHNMLEPAALGKPVLVGPYTANFKRIVEFLGSHNAIEEVQNAQELKEKIKMYLTNSEARQTLGKNARRAIEQSKGATQITLAQVQKFISN